jgi:hypothetical protein
MRTADFYSVTGNYRLGRWGSGTISLGQSPFNAPSVFNFYRPGYTPPGTSIATEGMVAPEFQQLDESTLASYVNFVQQAVDWGAGDHINGSDNVVRADMRPRYLDQTTGGLISVVAQGDTALINHLNDRLLYGTMSTTLRNTLAAELGRIVIPRNSTQSQILNLQRRKIRFALLITAASPDFLVQR